MRLPAGVCSLALALALAATPLHSAEKIRVAYPTVAPGLAPVLVTGAAGMWEKYGVDVELILVSGGARAVPALISNSVQFLMASDTGVTQAILQGIPLTRLGVTTNTLGSSLVVQPGIQSVKDLKGKVLGISMGRDLSYARLAKVLRDNGLSPTEDVKLLPIGGGEPGRFSTLKAERIHGTMLFPPFDLMARNAGMNVLVKLDIPSPAGGVNTTPAFLKQKRELVIDFVKGYMEGIRYMTRHKEESVRVFFKYFKNPDRAAMEYLYDETVSRLAKDLRPTPDSIRYHFDIAALDDPRAKQLSEKDFWDSSVVEEIHRSGFVDQLYKK